MVYLCTNNMEQGIVGHHYGVPVYKQHVTEITSVVLGAGM